MMSKYVRYGVFGLLFLFLYTTSVIAHPGFARKYRMSCTTCHNPAPRLKPFGDDYAANGFVMQGQEPSRYHIDTGDDLLLLQALPPIGFRLDAYAQYSYDAKTDESINDLQTPYILKILSGGRATENMSYYFYFFMSERGEIAGVEDAFLYWRTLCGVPVNLTVGQFQMSDPMFKRELRLEIEDYQIYTTQVGDVPTTLTYDRGIILGYGMPWGTDVTFSVVNGNGIGPAVGHRFDYDNYKNLFFRASHGFDESFRIGGFAYYGKAADPSGATDKDDTMLMAGPDATIDVGKFQLNLQYLWRTDDNPMYTLTAPKDPVLTQGGFAEVIYAPNSDRSRWYLIGLYNYRTSDITDIAPGSAGLEYQSAGLTWTYLLARNLRFVSEYNYNFELETHRLTLGFFSAF